MWVKVRVVGQARIQESLLVEDVTIIRQSRKAAFLYGQFFVFPLFRLREKVLREKQQLVTIERKRKKVQ